MTIIESAAQQTNQRRKAEPLHSFVEFYECNRRTLRLLQQINLSINLVKRDYLAIKTHNNQRRGWTTARQRQVEQCWNSTCSRINLDGPAWNFVVAKTRLINMFANMFICTSRNQRLLDLFGFDAVLASSASDGMVGRQIVCRKKRIRHKNGQHFNYLNSICMAVPFIRAQNPSAESHLSGLYVTPRTALQITRGTSCDELLKRQLIEKSKRRPRSLHSSHVCCARHLICIDIKLTEITHKWTVDRWKKWEKRYKIIRKVCN